MQQKKGLFTFIFSLLFLLSACQTPTGAAQNIFRVATDLKPSTLFAQKTTEAANFDQIGQIMEGLVEYNLEKEIIGAGAEKWEVKDDGKRYIFSLQKNAKWSNGDRVVAQDYVFAWQTLAQSEDAPYKTMIEILENGIEVVEKTADLATLGVKSLDDYTLEVTLKQPIAYFLDYMAFPVFHPLNKKAYETIGAEKYGTSAENIVTNGPFTITSFHPDSKIIYKKNDAYWNKDAVKIQGVEVNIIPELTTQGVLFNNNELDVIELKGELVDQFPEATTIKPQMQPYINYLYLSGNTATPQKILANKNFRKAIATAIDKELITTKILRNGSVGLDGLVPAAFGTINGQDYRTFTGKHNTPIYNPETAKSFLALAKKELASETLAFELKYPERAVERTMYENIKAQIEQNLPGVQVTLISMPTQTYFPEIRKKATPAAAGSWGADYFDVSTFFSLSNSGSSTNYSMFQNNQYDAFLQLAEQPQLALNPEQRLKLYAQAEDIVLDEANIIPLLQRGSLYNVKPYVKNYQLGAITPTIAYKYVELTSSIA